MTGAKLSKLRTPFAHIYFISRWDTSGSRSCLKLGRCGRAKTGKNMSRHCQTDSEITISISKIVEHTMIDTDEPSSLRCFPQNFQTYLPLLVSESFHPARAAIFRLHGLLQCCLGELIGCLGRAIATYDWLVVGPGPPLWKVWVNWDDEIPNICENKKCSKPPTRWVKTLVPAGYLIPPDMIVSPL